LSRERLEFARKPAREHTVNIDFIQADVTQFEAKEKFDLILILGVSTVLIRKSEAGTRKKSWNYFPSEATTCLSMPANRIFLGLGPKRKTRIQIEEFFKPELKPVDFSVRIESSPPTWLHQNRSLPVRYEKRADWRSCLGVH